jgi:hypothetical protein
MKKAPHANDFAKYDDATFARAVITVHNNKIFDDPLDAAVLRKTADRWNKVYEVAAGLIALRNLAEQELDRLRSKQDGLRGLGTSGLRQAIGLLDALATGKRHPIYDLVSGIQSKAFRAVRTKPNVIEKMDRDDLIALVRVLKRRGVKESVAIEQIICTCKLTPAEQWRRQIRDWNRRSKDKEPEKIAAVLARSPDRILERAAKWAAQTFSIPPAPVNKEPGLSKHRW